MRLHHDPKRRLPQVHQLRRHQRLFVDKPVYNLIVLPFEHEVTTEERTVYNVATCLKSSYLVADAIFLVDNPLPSFHNFLISLILFLDKDFPLTIKLY